MKIIKLVDSDNGSMVCINVDYIVAYHEDGADGTKIICGAQGGRVFFVKESPDLVTELINS